MREVTQDDCIKLSNIPIKRISKFSSFKADEYIKGLEDQMDEVKNKLANIVDVAIDYFKEIKRKYGKGRDRKTEIRNFESIEATNVVVANEKLYANRQEGFIGTGLKKDEFISDCSDIDDIIAVKSDGTYLITKVSDKVFVGKDIIHVDVFKKNDKRTIYNVIYRDGLNGAIYMKRCAIYGITRDKEYHFTKGEKGSKILYMTVNPNGEAEVVKVYLKPKPRLKKLVFETDFSELAIKGRGSMGNILTKHAIHKIKLSEKGKSTLGGLKRWYDPEVNRLKDDGNGQFLGEFKSDDRILAVTESGMYRTMDFELTNHFDDDILRVERFIDDKVYSVVYYDADVDFFYLKRFVFEISNEKQSIIGDNKNSKLILITSEKYPQLEINFKGKHRDRPPEIVDVEEFIAVKGYKAKGKRLTTYMVKEIQEIEPKIVEEEEPPDIEDENRDQEPDDTNQMELDF